MARNVEIKARLSETEFGQLRQAVLQLTTLAGILDQTDTFFDASKDRLKLREFADGTAELIAYQRGNQTNAKLSDYVRVPIEHPQMLKESLERSIGIRGIVKKRRELFMIGQTRVHLDDVQELGQFVELEVVLEAEQSQQMGQEIADELVCKLSIRPESFISCAYMDLLEAADDQNAKLSS